MINLLLDIEDYQENFDLQLLKDIEVLCEKLLEEDGILCECEISLSMVSQEEIRKINKKFRKIDKPTDVLSFPQSSKVELDEIRGIRSSRPIILGDIIISFEQALNQSKEYNHSIERELLYLTCHSMYHLLGYDHMTEEDKLIMRGKEEFIMDMLGFCREY